MKLVDATFVSRVREIYIRNIIFGVSDGLVSTVGLLAGIDVSGSQRSTIILTGVVYAFVEGFSMAVGSFLSEESVGFGTTEKRPPYESTIGGIIMFIAFIAASFVPILPFLFTSDPYALSLSIGLSLFTLLIVGLSIRFVIPKIRNGALIRHAIKMVLLGGAAIAIGVVIGRFLKA